MGVVPKILAWLPAMLALVALASLILAVGDYAEANSGRVVLPFYLIWLMSLGAIGPVAFIGMNALSVQEDITFDLKKQTADSDKNNPWSAFWTNAYATIWL